MKIYLSLMLLGFTTESRTPLNYPKLTGSLHVSVFPKDMNALPSEIPEDFLRVQER